MQNNIGVPRPAALAGAVRAGSPHGPVMNPQHSQEIYHVLPRRAGALLIDAMLWIILLVVLAISVGMTTEPVMVETANGLGVSEQATFYLSFLQIWGVTCLWFAYLILSERFFGTTLGKKAFGLSVVQSDGDISGIKSVVFRQLPRFVIITLLMLTSLYLLVPVVFLVEAMVARSHTLRQRIGDQLADTVVAPTHYARILAGQAPTESTGLAAGTGLLPGQDHAQAVVNRLYAGFWPRLFALVVDFFVLAVLTELLAASGLTTSMFSADSNPASLDEPFSGSTLLEWILTAALTAAYFIFLNGRGATVGKRLFGLRVVTAAGQAPGVRRAAPRYIIPGIGHLIGLALGFVIFVGFTAGGFNGVLLAAGIALVIAFAYSLFQLYDGLSMLWNEHRQTLHDRVGNTFVVHKDGRSI